MARKARRPRARSAARKAEGLIRTLAREQTERQWAPAVIADGVRAVARDLEPVVTPGSLYWAAPFRYVVEQMAPRVCRMANLPVERVEEVGEYLIAAFNEYVVALVEGFDVEHFERWSAAWREQEAKSREAISTINTDRGGSNGGGITGA